MSGHLGVRLRTRCSVRHYLKCDSIWNLRLRKFAPCKGEIPRVQIEDLCEGCISPLQGALYHRFGQCTAAMIQKKTARCFLRCPSAYAAETAATDFSVAKRVCPSREEGVYGKTFIYTDVEAIQCQGKNILYHKPRKAGKPLCHLPHRRQ